MAHPDAAMADERPRSVVAPGRRSLPALMALGRSPCDEGVIHGGQDVPPCSRSTERAVLAATIAASAMTFVDGTAVNVVLPVLREAIGATAADAQWIVQAYMLLLAALLLVGGALGDRLGRRAMFAAGTAIFAAASVACGFASSPSSLIAARAVQGTGSALLVPGSLALISATFSKKRRGRAIGIWASMTSLAAGAGPVAGAWLVEMLSWRWIFFLNLPLAAIVLVLTLTRVPESRGSPTSARLDWPGAALVTAGLFATVYGLTEAASRSFSDARVFGTLLAGSAALTAFVMVERSAPNPMMPLTMFRSRGFAAANVLTLCLYTALGALFFVLPFDLIELRRFSVVQASAAMLPFVVVMFVLSPVAGRIVDARGPRLPLVAGPLITAVGFALFAIGDAPGYWRGVFPAVLVMSVGMALTVAPLTTTVMSSVGEEAVGLASGINNAASRVASLFAVALVGILTGGAFAEGLDRVAWTSAALAAVAGMSFLRKNRDS